MTKPREFAMKRDKSDTKLVEEVELMASAGFIIIL